MAADAEAEFGADSSDGDAGGDQNSTNDSSGNDSLANDNSTNNDALNVSSADDLSDSNDTFDQDQQEENGDRDDLVDYLDSPSSELSTSEESSEWKSEISKDDVDGVTNYLNSDKGQDEYRELFDRDGNHITAQQAKNQIGQDQFKAVIYNPELELSKDELHQLADKLIESKSEKLGKDISAVYAVHQRANGTNGHLHIVYHAETKAELHKAQVDHTQLTKSELKDWIVERSEIINSVKQISEMEIKRNHERLASIEGKNRDNGTQRRDATIERYMGKSEHNMGNFSLTQVSKSFDHSVAKGTMSQVQKDRLMTELKGRCDTHVKNGLAHKVGENNYKFDRTEWQDHIQKQDIAKEARVQEKVNDFLAQKYQNFQVENTFNFESKSLTPNLQRDLKYTSTPTNTLSHQNSNFHVHISASTSYPSTSKAGSSGGGNDSKIEKLEIEKQKKLLHQLSL